MFCLFQCSQWEFSSQLYIELFATLFVLDWCCPVVLCSVTLLSLWSTVLLVKSCDTLHLHSIPSVQYQRLALLWLATMHLKWETLWVPIETNTLHSLVFTTITVNHYLISAFDLYFWYFFNCKANGVYFWLYHLGKILNYLWIIMYFRLLHSFDMCQIAILCCCIFWNL